MPQTTGNTHATVRLVQGNPTKADVLCGDTLLTQLIGWEDTTLCLERANARLFDYFETASTHTKNTTTELFLLEGGWVYAKRDGLAGPILWLFLFELIKEGQKRFGMTKAHIETTVPAAFVQALQDDLGLQVPSPANFPSGPVSVSRTGKDRVTSWRYIVAASRRVAFSKPRTFPKNKNTLLISLPSWEKHRYGTLPTDLAQSFQLLGVMPKEKPWQLDHQYEPDILSCHRGGGLRSVIRAFAMSLALLYRQRHLIRIMAKKDAVLADMVRYQFGHIYACTLHALCMQRLLERVQPCAIIRNGNYNTPDERRTNWACKRAKIPSIAITMRSLSARMPAMPVTYQREYNSLPDWFVLADNKSQKLLQSWGVPKEQISLGSRDQAAPMEKTQHSNDGFNQKEVVLLLLLDTIDVSKKMLQDVLPAVPKTGVRLFLRAHPHVPLSEHPDLDRLLAGWEWRDVSGLKMSAVVHPDRTLAISPCSSAGTDTVRCGAALLWMPYLSSNSVAHSDLMDLTGDICGTPDVLCQYLMALSDPKTVHEKARLHWRNLQNNIEPIGTDLETAILAVLSKIQST